MKSFCKSLFMGLILSVMTLLPVGQAFCQSAPKPAVVVSIANLSEQLDDVEYLLAQSGFGNMKFMVKTMIKGYTKGLDTSKDAGVMLYFNEGSEVPDFLGFVPVKDIDDMLDIISGMAEVEESGDDIKIIADNGEEFTVREKDGYAFFSNKAEMFDSMPGSPQEMVGELATNYNLAARIFGQRIPQAMRDQLLDVIQNAGEQTLDTLGDDDIQAELQRKNLAMQLKQMKMVLNEVDSFTVGMQADKESKKLSMDFEFKGLPNSELAAKMADSAPKKKSRFTGFLMDDAAFTMNYAASMSDADAKELSGMLDGMTDAFLGEIDADGDMSDVELAVVEKALDSFIDVAQETLKEGVFDAGAVVMLGEGSLNFAAATQVSNPKKLEATIKDLVEMAKDQAEGIEINLNSGSHKDITLHTFVIPVPEEEIRDALGDDITLIIGVGNKAVYIAAGSNPLETLKAAVDGTNSSEDYMQFNLYVAPILKFAASMEGDPAIEAMATALAESGGDRIRGSYQLIEDGGRVHFEMQDGILGLIKVGFDAFNQSGGVVPSDDF
ncbi:MAG: hypothetical protein ACI814_003571 [Mariniblastus sp.]